MKTKRLFSMLIMLMVLTGWSEMFAQSDRMPVPGDNFSLEGALELFKKSSSPEEFERMLNSPDTQVNNLDLNGDGEIDYIKVIDRNEGNVHAFILQAVISASEYQDVAVIELEKLANGKAVLQIIGDEDIYGIETIIEPTQEVRVMAGTSTNRVVVNVWAWPVVQYVYGPYYFGWVSPFYWTYRPIWWRPWRPITYVSYYSIWQPYRPYYSVCYTNRIVYARPLYRPYRSTSVIVYDRHHTQISTYRNTYSSTHLNRGRDDHYRSNSSSRESYNRYRSGNDYSRNNSSSNDQWRRQNNDRGGNQNGRNQSYSGSRNSENRSSTTDRTTNWRQNSEPNRSSGNTLRDRNSTNSSSFENRMRTDRNTNSSGIQRNQGNRPSQSFERKPTFEQRNSQPSYSNKSIQQRSFSTPNRSGGSSEGNRSSHASSSPGGNKSGATKRGRD